MSVLFKNSAAVMPFSGLNAMQIARRSGPCLTLIRNGHHMFGKPPYEAKSLAMVLAERDRSDPTIDFKVDIGFPIGRQSRQKVLSSRLTHLKERKFDPNLEKLARTGKLEVDVAKVKEESWETTAPTHLKNIAEHFGVFQHLFGDAYFTPKIRLDIAYSLPDEKVMPVYSGNIIKPAEAKSAPEVVYLGEPNKFYTLALTNPDGHLTEDNSEYVHWFIGNIPGSDVANGEVIWDYLQPFPAQGTGYQRLIFILYEQTKKLDYSALVKSQPCLNLDERTFSTLEFYRQRQDDLTPAGLAFFQSDWDKTLTDFFHKTLNMKEPSFEYDFPPPYIRPQEWFPLRKPFNLYMDKYRDPQQIAKEYLLRKLSKQHPFKPPTPSLRFPNAVPIDPRTVPSWLATEIRKARLREGRVNDY